ncbi:MAG: type II secretion system protein GspM [SAR86 cluster bacterium]|jgi:type II secretory pathway component PulM|nr:type II secretion system protein GspM [SAR86 cluster bacterium]
MKYYRNKLDRNQEILVVFTIFMALVLVLGGLYQGVYSWKEKSIQDLNDERILFLKIKKVMESSPISTSGELTAENFASKVGTIARKNGVLIDRLQPIKQGSLSITIKNVNFIDLLNLLRDLKSQGLVSISNASLRRNISGGKHIGLKAQIVLSL